MLLCDNQHHFDIWKHLPPELLASGRECSVVTGRRSGLIAPVWCGRTGERCHRAPWKTGCRWASLLPLICWQGPEDGNKAVSVQIPEPVAATLRRADSTTLDLSCHSKESWLDHFGLINKFVLPSQSSLSPLWSTEHPLTHHYWRSMTELWTTLDHGGDYLPLASYTDSLLLFPIFSIALLPFPISLNN